MNDTPILTFLLVLAAVCLTAEIVGISRARKKRGSPRREALRQRLRNITLYNEAKSDRLVDFERDELKRKGRPDETVEDLMERAIGRWERENAAAASI